jgi:hypothetical protein
LRQGCDLRPPSALATGKAFGCGDERCSDTTTAPPCCDGQIGDAGAQGLEFEDIGFKRAGEKSNDPGARSSHEESAGVSLILEQKPLYIGPRQSAPGTPRRPQTPLVILQLSVKTFDNIQISRAGTSNKNRASGRHYLSLMRRFAARPNLPE